MYSYFNRYKNIINIKFDFFWKTFVIIGKKKIKAIEGENE